MNKIICASLCFLSLVACKMDRKEQAVVKQVENSQVKLNPNFANIFNKHIAKAKKNPDKLTGLLLAGRAQNLNVSDSVLNKNYQDFQARINSDINTIVILATIAPMSAIYGAFISAMSLSTVTESSILYGTSGAFVSALTGSPFIFTKWSDADWTKAVQEQQAEVFSLKKEISSIAEGDAKVKADVWSAISDLSKEVFNGIDIGAVPNDDEIGFYYLLKRLKP